MKNIPIKMPGKLTMEGVKEILSVYKENFRIREEEDTKRHNISAIKEYEIEKIRAHKEVLKDYLEMTFSERRTNFNKMFDLLDKGLDSNNMGLIQSTMSAIVTMAIESPLQQVEKLKNDFNNPDIKEIEI